MGNLKITVGASVDEELKAALAGVTPPPAAEALAAEQAARRTELLTTIPGLAAATMGEAIHVFHRQPDPAVTDRRSPRSVCLDDVMAIEPTALERAFFPFFNDDDDDQREYDVEDGVATICIDGPIMQRGGWWYEGYDTILDKFDDALEDAEVEAVVLKINSPGGVCSGCFSAARSMIDLKKKAGKPVYAFADESAYSAAYALACVADEIYLPREGGVGSVGVIGVLQDWTAFNERVGIKVAVITSGAHKADGHPDMPLKADVIARYQARVTQLGGYFAELVGASRGMTTEAVLALQADCLYGDAAVAAGLANGVKSFEDVMALATGKAVDRIATRGPQMPVYSAAADKNTRMKNAKTAAAGAPQETPMTMLSLAAIALAVGLTHEATEGDILAAVGRSKAESDKAKAESDKALAVATATASTLLEAHGAKTAEEAIGKLEAERSTLEELVGAVVGKPEGENAAKPTAKDAIAKLASERRGQAVTAAKAMIETAIADGKVASNGEKAFGIFEKHGMAALEAHLDALVPHTALKAEAPTQKDAKGTAPTKATKAGDVVLSAEDEDFIAKYEIDREKFIAKRQVELADKAAVTTARDGKQT
jgi:ClpP class serine protease